MANISTEAKLLTGIHDLLKELNDRVAEMNRERAVVPIGLLSTITTVVVAGHIESDFRWKKDTCEIWLLPNGWIQITNKNAPKGPKTGLIAPHMIKTITERGDV